MLAPAFYLPLWVRGTLRAMHAVGPLVDRIYVSGKGSDIHDAAARSTSPSVRLWPLGAALQLRELSAAVRPRLNRITQPALVIHSRRDHTCPMRTNVKFAVILEESFHVITVDSEKERVASEVIDFVSALRGNAQPASATG
jgi:carboxylesterase